MGPRLIRSTWMLQSVVGKITPAKRLSMRKQASDSTRSNAIWQTRRRWRMPEDDYAYKVGYGKPPKSGKFVKGISGNPKGRPKNSKNLTTTVLKESRQLVHIKGPHGTRAVTKLQAAVMQISNKSAQGDLRASREFFSLVQRS